MGAGKAIRKIMIDKQVTVVELAEKMDKAYSTLLNAFQRDKFLVSSAVEYGEALGCTLCYRDDETGDLYTIR